MILKKRFSWNVKHTSFLIAVLIHAALLAFYHFNADSMNKREEKKVFRIVDIQEKIPKKIIRKIKTKPKEKIVEEIKEDPDLKKPEVEEVEEIQEIYYPQHKITRLPKPIDLKNEPVYPPLAKRKEIEGRVILEVYFDKLGIVRNIEVLKDPGFGFVEAVKKYLEKTRFYPAYINDDPVPAKVRRVFSFTIRK